MTPGDPRSGSAPCVPDGCSASTHSYVYLPLQKSLQNDAKLLEKPRYLRVFAQGSAFLIV